uniref:Uncharacterized protein n=1 Tax=Lactuca sativa TaxID=4236 RepID=A0A9R1XXN8_LACSA|nr:hypothetical protein LSAT_V11C100036460 [Lactuca sativa]
MKITDIPFKLRFYILQKFDSERLVIDVEGKELKATPQFGHDMLGIPNGGTILTQLDQWPKDDTSYDEWKQHFTKGAIIRLNAIKKVNVHTTKVDFNFKLNFLVLFFNTFYLEDSDSDKDEDDSVEFPEKEILWIFKGKMTNMIVEEKTESTTFFEFLSNETGVEGINLTPAIGQKTNDEKENEDKEGNGEEDNDNDGSQPEVDYLFDSNEAKNEGIKNDRDNNKKK